MHRIFYEPDHHEFRAVVAEFVRREVAPHVLGWEEDGLIDREVWFAAGKQGIIGLSASPEYGGAGQAQDYRFRSVVLEELAKVHATSLSSGFSLQDDIVIPYISALGTDEQRARWLPALTTGEVLGAIAMTEPGTGSDLRGITTTATPVEGGWVLNGAKTFITSGILSDLVVVVARTDTEGGSRGFTLLVVERGAPGFRRGRKLRKIGLHGQDTAELVFEDVFVSEANVLGQIGGALRHLAQHLPLERLSIAAQAAASSQAVVDATVTYTDERTAFGQPIADFQNTRFVLADVVTEVDVMRTYVDRAVLAFNAGGLDAVDAAKAKLFCSETQNRVVDRCLQLHGGYGYMVEYPVARAFQDARVQRIFGGTSEIMREIIGRDIVGRR